MADGDLRTGTLVQRQRQRQWQWQAERQLQQQRGVRGRQAPWITRRPAARGGAGLWPLAVWPAPARLRSWDLRHGAARRAFISKNAQGMGSEESGGGSARAADAVATGRQA